MALLWAGLRAVACKLYLLGKVKVLRLTKCTRGKPPQSVCIVRGETEMLPVYCFKTMHSSTHIRVILASGVLFQDDALKHPRKGDFGKWCLITKQAHKLPDFVAVGVVWVWGGWVGTLDGFTAKLGQWLPLVLFTCKVQTARRQ